MTWDGNTWNNTDQGTIAARYENGGDPIEDRTGDDFYPPFVEIVDGSCRVFITLRNVKQTLVIGTKSNIVLTLSNEDTTSAPTIAGMKLVSIEGSQGRAVPGTVDLIFIHESTDGSTDPVT